MSRTKELFLYPSKLNAFYQFNNQWCKTDYNATFKGTKYQIDISKAEAGDVLIKKDTHEDNHAVIFLKRYKQNGVWLMDIIDCGGRNKQTPQNAVGINSRPCSDFKNCYSLVKCIEDSFKKQVQRDNRAQSIYELTSENCRWYWPFRCILTGTYAEGFVVK